mmetsp:Transcript_25441/g.59230  ORF Transcript_25441/g.59230 Transcript_25441/m.59230 type:complete len:343 (+) Transcript_25441:94-1122(+)
MWASGSVPLSARSASSSTTQRTGGTTARSSDGKGTPRDCERLSLSDLRSSAQLGDDLSARGGYRQGDANWPAQRTPLHSDLSRELEIMRFVIVKENEKLKEQLRQLKDECSKWREKLELGNRSSGSGAAEPSAKQTQEGSNALSEEISVVSAGVASHGPPRWLDHDDRAVAPLVSMVAAEAGRLWKRRRVEWRIHGPGLSVLAESAAPASQRTQFTLPEMPGALFHLTFTVNKSESGKGNLWPCRLSLRLTGAEADALACSVQLGVQVVGANVNGRASNEGDAVMLSDAPAEHVLQAHGEWAHCPCRLPPETTTAILCTVELLQAGFCPAALRPLRLVSRRR